MNKDLNTALYEKMAAEQDKYRDWLKSCKQPLSADSRAAFPGQSGPY